jgi:nucleotidyltransferase/DNA polymerase involved in DNA repair
MSSIRSGADDSFRTAFFAACHQREDPTLEGTAFAVGEGVLTTASYEARKFGCRSAMVRPMLRSISRTDDVL